MPLYMNHVARAKTVIFSDGFESGTFLTTDVPPGAWTGLAVAGGGSATISAVGRHDGLYNAKFVVVPAGWSCVKKSFAEVATGFMRAYYTFSTLPATGETVYYAELRADLWYNMVAVVLENVSGNLFWGLIVAYNGTSYATYETAPSNPKTGVPFCIELKRDVTNGLEELWIDGVSKATNNINVTGYSNEIVVGSPDGNSISQQTCYVDSVVVADAYIGPETGFSIPPTFANISTNTTITGQPCSFNCLINDNTNVSAYIFSTNNTGSWINDTAVVFSSFFNATAAWANVTKTLNDADGKVVSYIWHANDTSNNWSRSGQYNFTTSALQNYLTVISPYGTPGGQGWYNAGKTAYASVSTGVVDHGNGTRHVFSSWNQDASGANYVQSNPILMNGPKTAMANWKTQYLLTVRTNPENITTIPGEGWHNSSTNAVLAAPLVAGWQFAYWEIDGVPQGIGTNPVTLNVTKPHTATAYYIHHDVAVSNVAPLKSIAWINGSIRVNVTVTNLGDYTETFNVTVYANTAIIGQTEVTLTSGNSKTITLTWNTTGFAKGNYTISTYAWPVPDETNTANNTYTYGIVKITILGDTNGDRKVNVLDLILIALHLGHTNGDGHTTYSPDWYKCMNTDLNSDGQHNVLDLIACALHLGQHW